MTSVVTEVRRCEKFIYFSSLFLAEDGWLTQMQEMKCICRKQWESISSLGLCVYSFIGLESCWIDSGPASLDFWKPSQLHCSFKEMQKCQLSTAEYTNWEGHWTLEGFIFLSLPLEVVSTGVKPLRLVSKLVELLLCQYQLSSGSSAACTISQVSETHRSGQWYKSCSFLFTEAQFKFFIP